jgi:hypothetical protein
VDGGNLYAILEVARDATPDEIRVAYRKLARQWHPDSNANGDTSQRFRLLNHAYTVLSHPERRADYDRNGQTVPPRQGEHDPAPAAAPPRSRPICCTECGKLTAQPRLLVFRQVVSFVVWSHVKRIEGVFCSKCAHRIGLNASAATAFTGWWAIPLGPFLSIGVIALNAMGGGRKPATDRRLALLNAEAFLESDNSALAYALARPLREDRDPAVAKAALRIVERSKAKGLPRMVVALKDPWGLKADYLLSHLVFVVGPVSLFVAIGMLLLSLWRLNV